MTRGTVIASCQNMSSKEMEKFWQTEMSEEVAEVGGVEGRCSEDFCSKKSGEFFPSRLNMNHV